MKFFLSLLLVATSSWASLTNNVTLDNLDPALQAMISPVPGPQGPQGIQGIPGQNGTILTQVPFRRTVVVKSNAAATKVALLLASDVGAGKKVFITDSRFAVTGGVGWVGVATCTIEDTTAISLVTISGASLISNAVVGILGMTIATPILQQTGATTAAGLRVGCNSNATLGSDLYVTVVGFIE